MDSEDTLLANISGTRKVWVANFEAVSAAVHRTRDDGGTTFLVDLKCDPSWHELKVCADNGVKWTGPVVLWSRVTPSSSRGGFGTAFCLRRAVLPSPSRS